VTVAHLGFGKEGGAWRARGLRAYSGGLGAEPLVEGSGERSPPEAEKLSAFEHSMEAANLPIFF